MVKREDSDSIDDESEVDLDKNQDDVFIEGVNDREEEKYPRLSRRPRIRTQTTTDYVPSSNNKFYPKGYPKGVNMVHIDSIGGS